MHIVPRRGDVTGCTPWDSTAGLGWLGLSWLAFVYGGIFVNFAVMFEFVKNRLRASALERLQQGAGERTVVFPNLGTLRSVAVLFRVESMRDVSEIEEFVGSIKDMAPLCENLSISGVVLECRKVFKDARCREDFIGLCEGHGFVFLGKEVMDWKGVPHIHFESLKGFLSHRYDLLVCMNSNVCFPMEFVAQGCESGFRVGMQKGGFMEFDMVLQQGNSYLPYKEFLVKLFGYLKVMQDGK